MEAASAEKLGSLLTMTPNPMTPYSPAAWSWRATAPQSGSPTVCPGSQGSLSATGQGERPFPQEGFLRLTPARPALSASSQQKQPQDMGFSSPVPPVRCFPWARHYRHTCHLLGAEP